ncbi:MAG TPA: hypothetical protein VJR05_04975 [Acidimicrobiia bacterium]|nr:hypothetical protein [Acidimicrobiia bacterium]
MTCHPVIVLALSVLRRSAWPIIISGFAGGVLVAMLGRDRGWSPLTIFIGQALLLGVLATLRGGIARLFMMVLILLNAIPVFGLPRVVGSAVVIYLVALPLRWRFYMSRMAGWDLETRHDQGVAEEARAFLVQYRQLGFQPVSAAQARGPGFETVFTYLLAPDRQTYAILTDQVQTFASRFGERVLVTMDRGALPVPSIELRQVFNTEIAGLWDHHRAALAAVADHGLSPDSIEPSELADLVVRYEKFSLDFVRERPWWTGWRVLIGILTRRRPDSEPIGLDSDRIKRWIATR